MDRFEALQAIRRLSKEEFEERIEPERLPKERQDLLFKFIQGEIKVSYSCEPDIEEYALKILMPEVYAALPHEGHPYSSCDSYEYDPPKNGQNIIKHGLGFGEVVSYSTQFGTLRVLCPDDKDKERYVIFSDFKQNGERDKLALPFPGTREINYTISIAHFKSGKFRFISARFMSSNKKKYEKTIAQSLRKIIPEAQARQGIVVRCVEIVETYLLPSTTSCASSA